MDKEQHFLSALNDKETLHRNIVNSSKYINTHKKYLKLPSFQSQKPPQKLDLETKIYNNYEMSKLPLYIQNKIKEYKLYPFKQLNLKTVGEDIKNKLFDERSSLSKEQNSITTPKVFETPKKKESKEFFNEEEKKEVKEKEKGDAKIILVEANKKKRNRLKQEKINLHVARKIYNKHRKLKLAKNLYDSFDDDESEQEEEDYYVINPETNIIIAFDFFIIIFFLYYFIYTTFKLCQERCFCSSNKNITFSDIVLFINDLLCIADLVISFFREYYNYDYKLVKINKLILENYLKYDFIFDLLSAIPIYTLSKYICLRKNFSEQCYKYDMSTNYILLKICSLLKAAKIKKILGHKKNQAIDTFIEFISENYTFERTFIFFLYSIKYIGIFHFFVCIHIFIGKNSYSNWLILTQSQDESLSDIYISSLYFIVTTLTTVGYGDIICQSLLERIYQIIILAIGSVLYPYVISSLGNFIKNDSNAKIKQENNLAMLESIRREYPNISFKLYNKIYNYLQSKGSSLEKYDTNSLIESLPYALKNIILFTMYKPIITNFKFFKKNNNSVFIAEVLNNLIPSISKKNEYILYEGEMVEEIIFIKDGKISLNAAISIENPMKSINKYFNENFSAFTTEAEKKLMNEDINNQSFISYMGDITYEKAKNKLNNAFRSKKVPGGEKSQLQIQTFTDKNEKNESYDFDIRGGAIINDEGDYQYMKILDIRKNEHFGSVFMTLNKPCPLSLQVKSKMAELFLLKKDQAVNLSKNYPNIWLRIYSKEFHNIRTIKKKTFSVLKKYIEINELLAYNNFNELMLTNDITSVDLNILEKSVFTDKTFKKSIITKSSLSKQDLSKNNSLNYEQDKTHKKLNLDIIKENLKSKMKKNSFQIRKNSTQGERKVISRFSNKNIRQGSSKQLNTKPFYFSGQSRKNSEEIKRIKRHKLNNLKLFLIESKKFFNFNNNKNIQKTSSFRSIKIDNKNSTILPKVSFHKSCLKKSNSPSGEVKYKINIIKDNKRNHLSSTNIEYNSIITNKEKNLSLNYNNYNNKYKTTEDILKDLKEICDEEADFSFCSLNEQDNNQTNKLSIERNSNFEICASYQNINNITHGKYIKDYKFQKKMNLMLKKYSIKNNKETNLNDSLSPKTLCFSSGFGKNHQTKTLKEQSSMNSFYDSNNYNIINSKTNNDDSEIKHKKSKKSFSSKKVSNNNDEENKNNFSFFTTFKKPNQNNSEKYSNETINTNSLKVNKNTSITNKDSIDIDIKKDANIFNNTEVEYVINRGYGNNIINEKYILDESNKAINYRVYKNKNKKNKKKIIHDKVLGKRNNDLINQVFGINMPNSNINTNNNLTTSSNMKDNKEVEKLKNIETSFSIYNIIQKNINNNLNIIDNKEKSPQKNYNRGFCLIT